MKSQNLKRLFTAVVALIAGIALLRVFAHARQGASDTEAEEAQEEAIRTPSRVFVRNGETFIRLSARERAQSGAETLRLTPARQPQEVALPARVLDVQSLVNLSANYAAAQANLRKAQNNLNVSRREYARLKALYQDHQNVSAKSLEAAEAAFLNDQTDVETVQRDLALQTAALRQSWGEVIAGWVAGGRDSLDRILNRQAALVQVTLPAGEPATAPAEVSLELPNQERATAKRVSRFPQVDPRIQGASFLYITSAQGALAPGLNLMARLALGPVVSGVWIPSSAIVWWQGQAWVYEQTATDEFTRRAVETNFPVGGGFLVSKGLSPGQQIVRLGAEALLSEEFRSQIQPEG